jgi:hypothetical protein
MALEELERPKAKDRKTSGTNQHTEPSGKLPEGSKGQTRDKVGAAIGMSGDLTKGKTGRITTIDSTRRNDSGGILCD